MPIHKTYATSARKHLKSTVNSNGYNGQFQLFRQLKSTLTKRSHVSRERARSLRKDDKRRTTRKHLASFLIGVLYALWTTLVNKNETSAFARLTYKWYIAQTLLHHPLEVAPEITIYQKNIECSLMVSDKHIRLLFDNVLTSRHVNRQEQQTAESSRPQTARDIAPIMRTSKSAPHNGDYSRKSRKYNEQRSGYA